MQQKYYEDKLKDEERVRAVYHDMKNHLLVLEGSQGTEATRQMAQELRAQIADYEDYIHTGNDFLDIIIKDKAEKAREKHIDFSAAIDIGGADFIEPLDISTLFGNGIDNAIEASGKLPEEQRVIAVKAGPPLCQDHRVGKFPALFKFSLRDTAGYVREPAQSFCLSVLHRRILSLPSDRP